MYDEWQLPPPQEEYSIKACDIDEAIRAAEYANWELDDGLPAVEPYDPFADDPE